MKKSVWPLHEAKAKFSDLFRRVHSEGPQRVVNQRGGGEVVVISATEYDRMQFRAQQPRTLVEFFQQAPSGAQDLGIARNRDTTREIKW